VSVEMGDVGRDLPDQTGELPGVGEKRPLRRQRQSVELNSFRLQLGGQLPFAAADDYRIELVFGAEDEQPYADRAAPDRRGVENVKDFGLGCQNCRS